ncbi:hypothetical protein P4C99_21085 [Pontiellaceae bacterium B1224]|nr:hypothetical protein [Pontiellaceae bacterium B1224]
MKRGSKKPKSVVKGAPSGFMISILIHVGAFALAGALVVFNVVNKEEKKFVPPKPVERPKMKLKKPKVKVKKDSKPRSSERIVTKVQKANMPEIYLPEMSGIGDGVGTGGGYAGFELMPDLSTVTAFGAGQSIGSDLIGTFYDFKRRRNGAVYDISFEGFQEQVGKFIKSGYRPSTLAGVYRSERKLYATCFMVPTILSSAAPSAFGEPDCGGWSWMCHYTGEIVYPEDITFRFVGQADDILVVAIDGEMVLNASWNGWGNTHELLSIAAGGWQSTATKSRQYKLGNKEAEYGDWVTLKAGVPVKMDVLMGEGPGGQFDGMLCVMVKGVEYETNIQQGPILPMFKTALPSHDLLDVIYEWLVPGEACLTNGPVFSDFGENYGKVNAPAEEIAEDMPEPAADPMHIWNLKSGQSFEGEFITAMGDKIVLKTPGGKQVKILKSDFSDEDQKFAVLSDPPDFSVDFIKTSTAKTSRYQLSPQEIDWNSLPPQVNDFKFGARVRQTGARPYNHELRVEYFAIGQQLLDDNKFILFDRDSETFTPTTDNKRMMEFKGERVVETKVFPIHESMRGYKFKGHLVLVWDERDEIIAYRASSEWLYEHREKLMKLGVGMFFNDKCDRVYPTGPKPNY